jgi:hypothetical protein
MVRPSFLFQKATALLLGIALAGCAGSPEPPTRRAGYGGGASLSQTPQGRACLASLGQSRASFTPLADRYFSAGCSTLGAVRLDRLGGDRGQFELANLGPVSCPLANGLQGWARFGVDRAARQILGSALVRIETMGSYSCRTVAGTNRLSAHATANAADIAAFRLADGRRISVLSDWNASSPQVRAFLRTVRDSACKRFGTVLSPDYNAAHRDHFHLEVSGDARGRAFCR